MEALDQAEKDRLLLDSIGSESLQQIANKKFVVESAVDQLDLTSNSSWQDEVDSQWISVFSQHAERASDDRLRDLWGKILSEELKSPGDFSLATMQFVSVLDSKIAQTFQKWSNLIIGGEFILKPEKISGVTYEELSLLAEYGLVSGDFAMVTQRFPIDQNTGLLIRSGELALIGSGKKSVEPKLSIVPLTRIGKELCRILPEPDHYSNLVSVFEKLRTNLTSASIAKVKRVEKDGQVNLVPIEPLMK